MAFYAFWQYGYNIWKMTPLDPPPPPQHMENSICLTVFFFESFPKFDDVNGGEINGKVN